MFKNLSAGDTLDGTTREISSKFKSEHVRKCVRCKAPLTKTNRPICDACRKEMRYN